MNGGRTRPSAMVRVEFGGRRCCSGGVKGIAGRNNRSLSVPLLAET